MYYAIHRLNRVVVLRGHGAEAPTLCKFKVKSEKLKVAGIKF